MKRANILRTFLLGLTLAGAMGTVSYADKCVPDPNAVCPLIYAPVTCNNGVTYSNQCFADADCAKGCRPADNAV
jgi:Kazal-type serine protease inhibitor-like protein